MPKNLTKFNTSWFSRVDSDNNPVQIWLKSGSTETTFRCSLCQTNDLNCGNQGWKAIEQHMSNYKHKNILNQWKQNTKFTVLSSLSPSSRPANASNSSSMSVPVLEKNHKDKLLSSEDQITKAEVLWSLNVAQKGFSYSSCNELNELFPLMFPDSSIAKKFSIQSDKMSYVISHGLGPYFKKQMLEDVKKADKFTLIFDEQTNNQNKKQLDMFFRYWCNEKQGVVNRFYKSVVLGHAYATTLRDVILESFATDGLNLNKLLMLGRDNPNVNISLENLINTEMKKQGGCLLRIGGCSIHTVHNAFKSGMTSSKWYVDNFCLDLYSWFKCSPARQEDFQSVVDDIDSALEKTILYFCITRWVLMGKVVNRILIQWEVLCDYFLRFLPEKQSSQIQKNKRFDNIKLVLSSNLAKVRLNFVLFLCQNIFDRFLTFFQCEEPLIHLLYKELTELYRNILLAFLKPDSVQQKSGSDLLNVDLEQSSIWLSDKEIRIGEQTRKLVPSLSFDEKKTFYEDIRKIYKSIGAYLKKNLPLNNMLLRDLQVLNCSSRTDLSSGDQIVRVARAIPNLLNDSDIDALENEWLLYSIEVIDRSWFVKDEYVDLNGNNHVKYHRIDDYWNKVFVILTDKGVPKYPTMTKLIKNALIISHGNADVERGFSINSNIVTENRSSLSESSVNGLRLVHDGVKFFGGGSAHKVVVNTDMINAVKRSSSVYREELMAEKLSIALFNKKNAEKETIQNEKQQHLEDEKQLLNKQKNLETQLKEAESLIKEGTNRLEGALKSGVLSEVYAANLLICGGREKLVCVSEQQQQLTDELDKLRLKRKDLFLHEQSITKKMKICEQK
ncbi:unnamed protein product [Adineta ricciae]|uniref:HAT C-terminal dimerisation domain-containing protein n=1 Tax=Adineta ricciae TaxID=249248 RepID=A0A815KBI9_ADIRI|nr:unnamed protein product [Adineta ricciae]CAF1388900.1 unnamed protein product [Adineta ricciae]